MFSQLLILTTSVLCAEGSSSLLESIIEKKRGSIIFVLSGHDVEGFSLIQEQEKQVDDALKTGYHLKVLAEEMGRGPFPYLTGYDSMSYGDLEALFNQCTDVNLALEQKLQDMARKQEENAAVDDVCCPRFGDLRTIKQFEEVQNKLQKIQAAKNLQKSGSLQEFTMLNIQFNAFVEELAQIRFNVEECTDNANQFYVECKNRLRGIILE